MKWVHVKTGGQYVIVGVGVREADLTPEIYYRNVAGGSTFSRPAAEFLDGRFITIDDNIKSVKIDNPAIIPEIKVGDVVGQIDRLFEGNREVVRIRADGAVQVKGSDHWWSSDFLTLENGKVVLNKGLFNLQKGDVVRHKFNHFTNAEIVSGFDADLVILKGKPGRWKYQDLIKETPE